MAALAALAACDPGPDVGGTLLVTSGFTDQVFVLDAATGAVVDSVALDRRPGERDEPHGVAVSPDGRHWYATVAHGEPSLWKFEAAGHRLVGRLTLPLRGAGRVRLSPDGRLAAVTDYWRAGGGAVSQVALVRTHDLAVVTVADVCPAPHDAVFDPAGARLAVTCAAGRELVLLDAATLEVLERRALADGTGVRPMNAAWSADGASVFVSLMGRGAVAHVAVGSGRGPDPGAGTDTLLAVGEAPAQLERAGRTLVVAERGARSVSLLDPATERGRTVGAPGAHPHGVAVAPDGRTAWITYEGDVGTPGGVWAVDVRTGRTLWHTPVGIFTLGVAYLPSSSSSSSSDAELMQ